MALGFCIQWETREKRKTRPKKFQEIRILILLFN